MKNGQHFDDDQDYADLASKFKLLCISLVRSFSSYLTFPNSAGNGDGGSLVLFIRSHYEYEVGF